MEGPFCVFRVPPLFLTPSGPLLPAPFPLSYPLLLGSTLSPNLGLVMCTKSQGNSIWFHHTLSQQAGWQLQASDRKQEIILATYCLKSANLVEMVLGQAVQ